jgi:hypothetical protein
VLSGPGSGSVLQDSVGEHVSFENKNDLVMPVESSPPSVGCSIDAIVRITVRITRIDATTLDHMPAALRLRLEHLLANPDG